MLGPCSLQLSCLSYEKLFSIPTEGQLRRNMSTAVGCRKDKSSVDWEKRKPWVWISHHLLKSYVHLINLVNFFEPSFINGGKNFLTVSGVNMMAYEIGKCLVKTLCLSFLPLYGNTYVCLGRNVKQWMMSWISGSSIKPQQNNKRRLYLDRLKAFRSADTERVLPLSSIRVMCACFLFGQEYYSCFWGDDRVIQSFMESPRIASA